ncbi:hypothetical protein M413DRAFT_6563 [Hebeloma cylindrosporum]|uniref:Insecticide toxin TcdB middle/N-terminal domain-containing protein n=1 Tax=Hebeloma cylindrosporum TaxID=76867 RepID=A0A0C3CLK5_HEBCY|nr:hypothetical protein M413DRAFT_6563 [Hebeloma cylindrosporum h7]
MPKEIIGTLPMTHNVDHTGSFAVNVPLQLPECRFKPVMSLAYHSSSTSDVSVLGIGWALKGAPLIERVAATMVQDRFRGSVKYNVQDRFALEGQRLIKIAETTNKTEYCFEIDDNSKIYAFGPLVCNPNYWEHHLADGTVRTFGNTQDSKIKGHGITFTRVWAINESSDAFTNYLTFKYTNEDSTSGAFYLHKLEYGGNRTLAIAHNREVSFLYEDRRDSVKKYFDSPLTNLSRLESIVITDANGDYVSPLTFDWYDGGMNVFDHVKDVGNITVDGTDVQIIPLDVNANGTQYDPTIDADGLHVNVYLVDHKGKMSATPAKGSGTTGLHFSSMVLPLDVDGNGKTDLVHIIPSDGYYTVTVLISTINGYQYVRGTNFYPDGMNGKFQTGDFQGNGLAGLFYLYETAIGNTTQFKFTQLKYSIDAKRFIAMPEQNGPQGPAASMNISNTRLISGDLNGNGHTQFYMADLSN